MSLSTSFILITHNNIYWAQVIMTVSVEKIILVSFKERRKKIRNISHFPLTFIGTEGVQHVQRCVLQATRSKLLISKWLDKTITEGTPYRGIGKSRLYRAVSFATEEPWLPNHVWRPGCQSTWRVGLQLVLHYRDHLSSRSGKGWGFAQIWWNIIWLHSRFEKWQV